MRERGGQNSNVGASSNGWTRSKKRIASSYIINKEQLTKTQRYQLYSSWLAKFLCDTYHDSNTVCVAPSIKTRSTIPTLPNKENRLFRKPMPMLPPKVSIYPRMPLFDPSRAMEKTQYNLVQCHGFDHFIQEYLPLPVRNFRFHSYLFISSLIEADVPIRLILLTQLATAYESCNA